MAIQFRALGVTIVHDGCVHRPALLSPAESRRLNAARAAVKKNLPPIAWEPSANAVRDDMLDAIVWSYECATVEDARASLAELEAMVAELTGGRRAQTP